MTVEALIAAGGFRVYAGGAAEQTVCGCYIGDVLSLAMSRIQAENVWLTVQSHLNVVAVASLAKPSCIILAEGIVPTEDVLHAAKTQGITILGTEGSLYQTACKLYELGIREGIKAE